MKNSILEIFIEGKGKAIPMNKKIAYFNFYIPFCKENNLKPFGYTTFCNHIKKGLFSHDTFIIQHIKINEFYLLT
jgi:hypothetical protein